MLIYFYLLFFALFVNGNRAKFILSEGGYSQSHHHVHPQGQQPQQQQQISRKMQENCPIMELKANCPQYFFAIWDNQGNYVYDSFLEGINFSQCYDPKKCYRIEITSESGVCDYQVSMGGKIAASGKASYDSDKGGTIIYVGANCEKNCPGSAELLLVSYFDYGPTPYTIYIANEGKTSGVLQEGNSAYFCIDLNKCNIISRSLGFPLYYVLDGNTLESVDNGVFENYVTLGNCPYDCGEGEDALLIAPDNQFSYTYTEEGTLAYLQQLTNDQASDAICIRNNACAELEGQGKATYYFFRDGEVYDQGLNTEYRFFGECEMVCDSKPILSSTRRGEGIVSVLATISGMSVIADFNSPQYDAACWLINDDIRKIDADDAHLIQRYVLSLLYLSTNGKNWINNLGFLSGKDECDWGGISCNARKKVTDIFFGENNVTGPITPEFLSLLSLETFNVLRNRFTGTIPTGIARLANLTTFKINDNGFTGTIPSGLLLLPKLSSVQLNGNMLTGTIPSIADNSENIEFFLLQDNSLTGTIPNWILDSKQLSHLYLHTNNFTGTLSDRLLALPKLEVLHLHRNSFGGTIPENFFIGTSIRELRIHENRFEGTIPKDIIENELTVVSLNGNQLTGQIPSEVATLSNLQQLFLNDNFLSGTFPEELGKLDGLADLRVENNNITGKIPFDNCNQFSTLSADCSVPQNVECQCCSRCFGLFTSYHDILTCASSEMELHYNTDINSRFYFYIENVAKQLILEDFKVSKTVGFDYNACISPTDCFVIDSNSDTTFTLSVDKNIILEDIQSPANFNFGYSSEEGFKVDSCDDVVVCGKTILAGSSKRRLLNMLTKFEGVEILTAQSSLEYEALCWWLNDIDTLSEAALQNTALIQRYILALLYRTTGGDDWTVNTNWLSPQSECTWYGVSCDGFSDVVNKLDLKENNLVGILRKEIGELRGLETLILSNNQFVRALPKEIVQLSELENFDISNNTFDGTIHSEIQYLQRMKSFDISSNRFSSSIPSNLGLLFDLEYMNLADNALSGGIPESYEKLKKLRFLSIAKNLLNGNLDLIENFKDLEHLDASSNYFTGRLPIFGGSQKSLKRLYLNNNQLTGAIPSWVEGLASIEEFIISTNSITGSLPTQLGNLQDLSMLSVSYNLLKGTIPLALKNIKSLDLLHLHSNGFEGKADYFDYIIFSFISDCGNTEIAPAPVTCAKCTQCCNLDGNCITGAKTWPKGVLYDMQLNSALFVILLGLGICCLLITIAVVLANIGPSLPRLPYDVRKDFNDGSAFRFYLSSRKIAWVIASLATFFELWVIFIFLQAGDISEIGNQWLYSESCPEDSLVCQDYSITNVWGWITFAAILATFLLPDLLNGLLLFYECNVDYNLQGIVTSIVLIAVTVLSIVASTIFINATSISNIAIIQDAVIVLFLNSIDEQFYMIAQRVAPNWVEDIEAEIIEFSILKATREISEIIDDDDYDSFDEDMNQDFNAKNLKQADAVFGQEDTYNGESYVMAKRISDVEGILRKGTSENKDAGVDYVTFRRAVEKLEEFYRTRVQEYKEKEIKKVRDFWLGKINELRQENKKLLSLLG